MSFNPWRRDPIRVPPYTECSPCGAWCLGMRVPDHECTAVLRERETKLLKVLWQLLPMLKMKRQIPEDLIQEAESACSPIVRSEPKAEARTMTRVAQKRVRRKHPETMIAQIAGINVVIELVRGKASAVVAGSDQGGDTIKLDAHWLRAAVEMIDDVDGRS